MSRIINDTVEIELNGKKYKARLDLLCIAEAQYYFKSRGNKLTVPQMFEAIQEEDYMVICNLIIFAIKSCNPSVKMYDIYDSLKFANRHKITEQLILLINKAMPENDEEDKKKEEEMENSHPQNEN